MTIKAIETQKTVAIASVVETLRAALERAEDGELTGVMLAATTVDGAAYTAYSTRLDSHGLISAIEIAKHRMIAGMS